MLIKLAALLLAPMLAVAVALPQLLPPTACVSDGGVCTQVDGALACCDGFFCSTSVVGTVGVRSLAVAELEYADRDMGI